MMSAGEAAPMISFITAHRCFHPAKAFAAIHASTAYRWRNAGTS
jgi:hypothetical protein